MKRVAILVPSFTIEYCYSLLQGVTDYFKDKDVRILFYDMAVYNIASELGIANKLVIYQDHLNASGLSNKFYLFKFRLVYVVTFRY